MHVLSFVSTVEFTFSKSSGPRKTVVEAYQDYVFSNIQRVHGSADGQLQQKLFKQTYLEARLPPFKVNPLGGKGERVLFYAGAGGYGDQLMSWPVVKLLHKLGYVVDVMVDPGNEPCWQEVDFVRQLVLLPTPLGDLYAYDHLAIFEFVTNADGHAGQMHPTDNLLFRMGLDPKAIAPKDKIVPPLFTVSEQLAGSAWTGTGLYQLASSNPLRNLSPQASVELLLRVQDMTGHPWLAVADKYLPPAYYEECEKANVKITFFPDVRDLMAAGVYAKLAIGPDSFLTHLRGHGSRPGIFYFGTIEPGLRLAYYPTVHGVWAKEVCKVAPCHLYTNTFPPWCPTASTNACGVITAAPKLVLETLKKCLQSSTNTP